MTVQLWDMHVHLDFMRDPARVASEADDLGLFAVTVTPAGYEQALPFLREVRNVRLAAGLHPWWVADGRCGSEDIVRAAEFARGTRFVGEIGLDASPKHVPPGSLEKQAEAFELICRACAAEGPKILSIHSVQAADLTLDVLERTGCLDSCRCIFHWFTGSGPALTRAVRSGCFFSVNEMMLGTRRGREYARQIPADRLLLETDLPPGEDIPFSAAEIRASLERTLTELNSIRSADMRPLLIKNASRILNENCS